MGKKRKPSNRVNSDSGKPRTSVAEVSNRHEKDYVKKKDGMSDTHHRKGNKINSLGNSSRSVKRYHGLANQGATCYLNSVLQVLFMTKDFRAAVERDTNENPDTDCIDRHLATLFADLKKQTAHTYKITRKLGIIRVCEQQDAAEYFEKILRQTRSGASQIYHGQLTHKTICTTCSTEADSDGEFWHLPLALVDSNSEHNKYYRVVDGIEDYFRSSEFSGENQIYCDQCDAKSDATIKRVIKHHPEVLMLMLKRFEFNFSYMSYVKINRTVEVPFTLQIPENQTYELYAVVDHFGSLRGGHYTATIKDGEGWYTFNDSTVTLLSNQPFQNHFEKSSSAYLLFYTKMNDNMEVSTPDKKRKREAEGAEEEGNATKVAVSRDSAGSPDHCDTEENQDTKSYNYHESNEETNYYQDAHAKKQRDEEDVGGNAQADEQTEKTQLVESVKVQDSDSGKQRTPEAEVSDRHEVRDRNKQDEVSDTQRRVMNVKTDIGGKTEDDEQPERTEKSLTKYPDRNVGYQDNEDNAREDLEGTQEVGEDDDIKPVSVQMEGKTGEGERSSEGEKLFEFQGNRREGDREENMPEDDQTCKQGNSTMYKTREQQREDKIYVEEHKDGDDKHGQDVEDQNNEDVIRQNQPEQKISVVGVNRQTEEKGNTGDELILDKAESSLRRAGSAESRRLTEDQRVGDDEKTRQREEAEEAEEEGHVTMETEMKDIVGSREVRLSPDLCYTEKNQDTKSYNHHESNEGTNYYQDGNATKQTDDEGVGGNTQADEQTDKRETEIAESAEVQDSDSGKQRTPEAEVSDRHEEHDRNKQDEVSDTKRRVMNVKTDIGGKTGDDKQPDKRMDAHERKRPRYQDNEVSARQNINEDLGGTQEVGQDDDGKPVSVQEQGDRVTKEGKTGEGDEQDTKELRGACEKKSIKWPRSTSEKKDKKTKKKTKKKRQLCFPCIRQQTEDETSDSD